MADIATLKQRLADAEDALHALTLGRKPQAVTSDSGAVTYTPASAGELRLYIQTLKQQIAQASGGAMSRAFFPGFGR